MTDSIDADRSNRNIEQPPESVRRIPIDHVYGIIYCTTQELFEFGTSQLSFNETGEKSTNEGRRDIIYIHMSQHKRQISVQDRDRILPRTQSIIRPFLMRRLVKSRQIVKKQIMK